MDEVQIRLACLHVAADMAKVSDDVYTVTSKAKEYFEFVTNKILEPPPSKTNDEIPF